MGDVRVKMRTKARNKEILSTIEMLEKQLEKRSEEIELETDETKKALLIALEADLIQEITGLKCDIELNNAWLEAYEADRKFEKEKIDEETYKGVEVKLKHKIIEMSALRNQKEIDKCQKWIAYIELDENSCASIGLYQEKLERAQEVLANDKKYLEEYNSSQIKNLKSGVEATESTRIGKVKEQAQTMKARQQERTNSNIEKDTKLK